jgi:sugar phosphate isomerase/epimerase
MQAKAFRHLWGYPLEGDATFRAIRAAGYAGIEAGLPAIEDPAAFASGLQQHGLEFIGQVYTADFTKGHAVEEHVRSLEEQVCKLLPLRPVLINVHSGEDTWPLEEMHRYFDAVATLAERWATPLAHETHRGRCLFHPTMTKILLAAHPEIRLVADLSHWVCVCERLLEDQAEAIAVAAERTVHVHARMGYVQGPQVADPRSPLVTVERAAFEEWWHAMYQSMAARGLPTFSFCPEYGPAPYMPLLPFTGVPVTDLATICDWQTARVRELVTQWAV